MNVLSVDKLNTITHPLVSSIYLKKDLGDPAAKHHDDVLVIETNFSKEKTEAGSFNSYMTKLLSDLHDLQMQAEEKVGRFDRVDIRYFE